MLESLGSAISQFGDPIIWVYMIAGIWLGLIFGILPGLGGMVALAVLMPFIYGMKPFLGLAFLIAAHSLIYTGGAVTAILFGIPPAPGEAATVIELSRHPYIIGVKEASGNMDQIKAIIDGTNRDHFAVVSGEDHLVHAIMKLGGQGVISATANRWPREFQTLCELCLAGEWTKSEELQKALQPCVDATFCIKNPIPLHYMFDADIRPPLITIAELPEPMRSRCIDKINTAQSIRQFPHVTR